MTATPELFAAAVDLCRTGQAIVVEFTAPDGRDGRCLAYLGELHGTPLVMCMDRPDLESAVLIADAAPAPYESGMDEMELDHDAPVLWVECLPANRFRPADQFHQILLKNGRPSWKALGFSDHAAVA